jgi:DHA2 family multidrug resistance protein
VSPTTVPTPAAVQHRGLITISIMAAMIMQILDMTIANVALPHMQTSLGAAQDTITWVLTSYIVASAIATPITGWMADRIGRKQLFMICVAGFVISSALCGTAFSLDEMVLFRVAQGAFGAAMAPLSQAVLLDINPRERQGQAMALWGAGIMVAPIIGPTIGAWITDNLTWRWCFYINVPIGIACFFGMLAFLPDTVRRIRRFDFLGFALLSIFVGTLQLMLDRGQELDWFQSAEIVIETGIVIATAWMFAVHSATSKEPFLEPSLFRDRNFMTAMLFMFVVGMVLLAGMALLPPMMQNLFGYPVVTTGLILAPRGIGTMMSMMVVGRLVSRVDPRFLIAFGIGLTALSLWQMTGFSLTMTSWPFITTGVIQGFGLGFLFIPLQSVAFLTLDPKLRTEASAVFNLVRNLGSSIGISIVAAVLAQNLQTNHAELGANINIFNPNLAALGINPSTLLAPAGQQTAAILDALVTQQSAMISYLDDFKLMSLITLAALPLLLFFRYKRPQFPPAGAPPGAAQPQQQPAMAMAD